MNGWLNATFLLPARFWSAIKSGDQVGMQFQYTYEAPIFLGIGGMNLEGAKDLMLGIESNCVTPAPVPPAQTYQRYTDTDFFGADLTQTGIKGVSLARCEAICDAAQQCKAYSYVQSSQWCFPKFGIDRQVPKSGTISGFK